MPSLKSKIESLLFITNRPMSIKKLAELTKKETDEIKKAAEELKLDYEQKDKGIQLLKIGNKLQLATHPDNAKLVKDFIKDETTGELTRASLETLTIIAYRGPITRAELEQIRGVNCSIILRNLMIRGLIEAKEDKKKMQTYYNITFDFLKFLGLADVKKLPDYEKLSSSETLEKVLEQRREEGKRES